MVDCRLSIDRNLQSSIFNHQLFQGHLRLDFRDFVGELALELRQGRLDGLSPGRIEKLKSQASARQIYGLYFSGQRFPDDPVPPRADPEERVFPLGHPAQEAVARRVQTSQGKSLSALQSSALTRSRLDSGGTARTGFSPIKTRRTSSTTIRAISRRVSCVALPA